VIAESDELFFDTVKEHRGGYFVEYRPPVSGTSFATIALVFPTRVASSVVADAMEAELRIWVSRYRVPVMVSGIDETDSLISLTGVRPENHLVGWPASDTGEIAQSWKLDDLSAYLKSNPAHIDLKNVYADVPFRTKAQVKAASDKQIDTCRRQNRLLKALLIVWLVVIPFTTATVGYFAPDWLSLAIYVYSFWNAYRTWRKITGRAKPSKSAIEKAEKKRKMQHYYYHCERNPSGFQKLKMENFENDARDQVRAESSQLADPVIGSKSTSMR